MDEVLEAIVLRSIKVEVKAADAANFHDILKDEHGRERFFELLSSLQESKPFTEDEFSVLADLVYTALSTASTDNDWNFIEKIWELAHIPFVSRSRGRLELLEPIRAHPVWGDTRLWLHRLKSNVEQLEGDCDDGTLHQLLEAFVHEMTIVAQPAQVDDFVQQAAAEYNLTVTYSELVQSIKQPKSNGRGSEVCTSPMARNSSRFSWQQEIPLQESSLRKTSAPISPRLRRHTMFSRPPPLFPGETLVWRIGVSHRVGNQYVPGTLWLTTARLVFVPSHFKAELMHGVSIDLFLPAIWKIAVIPMAAGGGKANYGGMAIEVETKTQAWLVFEAQELDVQAGRVAPLVPLWLHYGNQNFQRAAAWRTGSKVNSAPIPLPFAMAHCMAVNRRLTVCLRRLLKVASHLAGSIELSGSWANTFHESCKYLDSLDPAVTLETQPVVVLPYDCAQALLPLQGPVLPHKRTRSSLHTPSRSSKSGSLILDSDTPSVSSPPHQETKEGNPHGLVTYESILDAPFTSGTVSSILKRVSAVYTDRTYKEATSRQLLRQTKATLHNNESSIIRRSQVMARKMAAEQKQTVVEEIDEPIVLVPRHSRQSVVTRARESGTSLVSPSQPSSTSKGDEARSTDQESQQAIESSLGELADMRLSSEVDVSQIQSCFEEEDSMDPKTVTNLEEFRNWIYRSVPTTGDPRASISENVIGWQPLTHSSVGISQSEIQVSVTMGALLEGGLGNSPSSDSPRKSPNSEPKSTPPSPETPRRTSFTELQVDTTAGKVDRMSFSSAITDGEEKQDQPSSPWGFSEPTTPTSTVSAPALPGEPPVVTKRNIQHPGPRVIAARDEWPCPFACLGSESWLLPSDWWGILDYRREFERQGMPSSGCWTWVNNTKYHVCDTYPEWLLLPKGLPNNEEFLQQVCAFRSRQRIPALTYVHNYQSEASQGFSSSLRVSAGTGKQGFPGAIMRCSQPRVGLRRNFCEEDEELLRRARVHHIFDARPRKNAIGNLAMGKGWEKTSRYVSTKLVFLNIDNIHVMRESLIRLASALGADRRTKHRVEDDPSSSEEEERGGPHDDTSGSETPTIRRYPSSAAIHAASGNRVRNPGKGRRKRRSDTPRDSSDKTFLSSVDSSKWFKHIYKVLRGALRIAKVVHEDRETCLIHCSDGWDRTSQLCALAQVLLDPFYRTIAGFAVLIEKDWLAFGHMFARRCGHGVPEYNDDNRSPVFLQFMDCLWQICRQFPRSFEYNGHFLAVVTDAAYSCRFGTFLYNSSKERSAAECRSRTLSLWGYISSLGYRVRNPFYSPNKSVLSPNVGTKFLSVWPYHTRLYPSMKPPEQLPFYDPFATCDPTPSMYSRPSMARFVLRAARGQINPHV